MSSSERCRVRLTIECEFSRQEMLDAIKDCLLPRETVLKDEKAFMDSIWNYLLISPTELGADALDGIPMDADTILKQAAAFQLDREGVVDDALAADKAPAPAE